MMAGILAVIYSPPPIPIGLSRFQLFWLDSSESNWNLWSPTGIQTFHWIPVESAPCHTSPHPCPTPQAVAHEAGGGWCIVPTIICPSLPHCSPIWLLAPTIHPMSSCSWALGWVLHHLCCRVVFIVVMLSLSLSPSLSPPLTIVWPLVHLPSTQ
jgi:hypothetical protein